MSNCPQTSRTSVAFVFCAEVHEDLWRMATEKKTKQQEMQQGRQVEGSSYACLPRQLFPTFLLSCILRYQEHELSGAFCKFQKKKCSGGLRLFFVLLEINFKAVVT